MSSIHVRRTDPHDNARSTSDTLAIMRDVVAEHTWSPYVARAVTGAIFTLQPWELRDECRVIRAVWYWVKGRVTFVDDESVVSELFGIPLEQVQQELLITPDRLLTMQRPRGDCDDFSMLTASMLGALGIPSEIVAIKADTWRPDHYSHVFVRAVLENGQRYSMDVSHGAYPGWESDRNFGEMVVGIGA